MYYQNMENKPSRGRGKQCAEAQNTTSQRPQATNSKACKHAPLPRVTITRSNSSSSFFPSQTRLLMLHLTRGPALKSVALAAHSPVSCAGFCSDFDCGPHHHASEKRAMTNETMTRNSCRVVKRVSRWAGGISRWRYMSRIRAAHR